MTWKIAVHRVKRLLKKRDQSLFPELGTNETSISKIKDGHIVKGYFLTPDVNGNMIKSYFQCMVIKNMGDRLTPHNPKISSTPF